MKNFIIVRKILVTVYFPLFFLHICNQSSKLLNIKKNDRRARYTIIVKKNKEGIKMEILLKGFREDVLAEYMVRKLKERQELTRIQELKCKLGIEVCLINLGKAVPVYLTAFLLHSVWLTFIFHSAYLLVRVYARGIHAQKSSTCTLISIFLFGILPIIIRDISISESMFWIGILAVYICLYKYAPQDTEKNRVNDKALRVKLRNSAIIGYSICVAVMVSTSSQLVINQVFFGSLLAVCCILPLTYKLLKK